MNTYRVFFYKDLCNSDGHSFKCLQRRVDIQSDDPSQAQVLAGRLVDNERLNADCVEVMLLADVDLNSDIHWAIRPHPPNKSGIASRDELTATNLKIAAGSWAPFNWSLIAFVLTSPLSRDADHWPGEVLATSAT